MAAGSNLRPRSATLSNRVFPAPELDACSIRLRVFSRVRQCLLCHPEERGLQHHRQPLLPELLLVRDLPTVAAQPFDLLADGGGEARRMIGNLRPTALDDLGLPDRLADQP
jgi:hypothetical protein